MEAFESRDWGTKMMVIFFSREVPEEARVAVDRPKKIPRMIFGSAPGE